VYTITFLNPKGDRPNFGVFKGYNIGTKCASGKHGTGQEGVNCYFPFKYDSIEYTAGNCRRYGVGGAYAYTKAENEEHLIMALEEDGVPLMHQILQMMIFSFQKIEDLHGEVA
jgi:hypothetical protein